MSIISTIDCTLRDGGYLNNWEFDEDFQVSAIQSLIDSKVEIVECGFISNISGNDETGTLFKTINKVNAFLKKNSFNNSNVRFAVMIRLEEYNLDDLPKCCMAENCVTIIRVMLYKNEIKNSIQLLKKIVKKGYDLHIQPTIISHYTDEEIVDMLKALKQINYKAISVTDTFGALDETSIKRITLLFDKYANKNARISLHCHNNRGNIYETLNSFCTSINKNRDVFIDTAINGIGRGAGNMPTEALLTKLKIEKSMNYYLTPVKTFCKKYMTNFKKLVDEKNFWAYIITGTKNMHPNYATYLLMNNYNRLDIYKLLELIKPEKYETFDYEYIKSLCEVYMIKV